MLPKKIGQTITASKPLADHEKTQLADSLSAAHAAVDKAHKLAIKLHQASDANTLGHILKMLTEL